MCICRPPHAQGGAAARRGTHQRATQRRRIPVRHALQRKLLSKRAKCKVHADLEHAESQAARDGDVNKFVD